MSDAIPYTPTTLDAIGEATDWMDLASIADGAMYIGKVTGTVTYIFEISHDERTSRTGITKATHTTDVAVSVMGPGLPRFGRHRITAGTGSVEISWSRAKNWSGKLADVNSSSRNSS